MKRQFLLDMKKFAELCKFSLHVDVIHIHVILEHQRHTYWNTKGIYFNIHVIFFAEFKQENIKKLWSC